MTRTTGLVLGLILAMTAGNALAQVDCTSVPCTETKYGLGLKPDYRKDEVPPNVRRYPTSYFGPSFGGESYFVSRTFETASNGSCGEERALSPLPGQIRLREQTGCTPTSEGPACSAGTNTGAACHLPTVNETCTAAGAPAACCTGLRTGTCSGFATGGFTNIVECGIGGVCSGTETGGCRVEIPNSDGGRSPETEVSEVRIFTLTYQAIAPNGDRYNLSASTGNGIGNSSFDGIWGVEDCTGFGTPHECCFGPGQGYCQVRTQCLLSSATTQGAVRRKPSMGTRYILPANRGGNGTVAGGTYVRWDSVAGLNRASFTDLATAFRILTDDTGVCCAANNPTLNTCTSAVPPATPNYPLLTKRTCGQEGRFVNEDNVVPDFIFAGAKGTAFHTDDDFAVPGTIPGVCTNNRATACYSSNANATCLSAGVNFRNGAQACCTGPGTGTCTANTFCTSAGQPFACCTAAGAGTCNVDPCGPLGDTCDLRNPGPRVQVGAGARDAQNNPRFDFCGGSIYIIRATPNQGCALTPRTQYNGDPGPDCGVVNYGIDHRDDNNCDGVADNIDRCPRASEWNQTADTDGDCGTPGSAGFPLDTCRGDECECGDQDGTATSGAEHIGNGRVNVSDIIGISLAQFGSQTPIRTCDANGDTNCNVQDIVAVNKEIFTPDSSICRQITPRQCGAKTCQGGPTPGAACTLTSQCGTGTCPFEAVGQPCCGQGKREFSELCDDGNLAAGDGCNSACRVEFQFTCTEDANGLSTCTHN